MIQLLYAVLKYAAMVPLALLPAATWAVYGVAATSLYALYRPVGVDHAFVPVALAFICWSAYRRDGWPGLAAAGAGAALGLAGTAIGGEIAGALIAGAHEIFWTALREMLAAARNFLFAWSAFAFWSGFMAGMSLFTSVILGLAAGVMTGMTVSGLTMYVGFVTGTARRALHRMLHALPPGAMALGAIPAAAFFAACEAFVCIAVMYLAAIFGVGFLLGSMMGSLQLALYGAFIPFPFFPIWWVPTAIAVAKTAADAGAYLAGLIISHFYHRMDAGMLSPAVLLSAILAYHAGFMSPAGLMCIAMALLLSRRFGHDAYLWIAVALMAHAFFALVGLVPGAAQIIGGAPLPQLPAAR